MPSVHVGYSQLKRSFNRMRATARNGTLPHDFLLLFYAAECGLKAVMIRNINGRTTADLNELTHNFSSMLRDLRIPPTLIPPAPQFKLRGYTEERFESSAAHQAWRYGADINGPDETAIVEWLWKVCTFAEERF